MGRYPVLFGQTSEFDAARRNRTSYPRSMPWSLVSGHDRQAQSNHSQTLERLAERGGLSPLELWCVVNDKKWREKGTMTEAQAIEWLRSLDDIYWKVP